jgi:hypothetical protein
MPSKLYKSLYLDTVTNDAALKNTDENKCLHDSAVTDSIDDVYSDDRIDLVVHFVGTIRMSPLRLLKIIPLTSTRNSTDMMIMVMIIPILLLLKMHPVQSSFETVIAPGSQECFSIRAPHDRPVTLRYGIENKQ